MTLVGVQVLAAFDGDVRSHVGTRQHGDLRCSHSRYAGKPRQTLPQLVHQGNGSSPVVSAQLRRNGKSDQILRAQAQILFAQIPQGLRKQGGPRKKKNGKRHLPRYEKLAETHVSWPRRPGGTLVLEDLRYAPPRNPPRGKQAEYQGRGSRCQSRKSQDTRVHF